MLEILLLDMPHTSLSWLSQALLSKQSDNQINADYANYQIGAK